MVDEFILFHRYKKLQEKITHVDGLQNTIKLFLSIDFSFFLSPMNFVEILLLLTEKSM